MDRETEMEKERCRERGEGERGRERERETASSARPRSAAKQKMYHYRPRQFPPRFLSHTQPTGKKPNSDATIALGSFLLARADFQHVDEGRDGGL